MGVRIAALLADALILGLTFAEAYRLLKFSAARRASTVLKVMSQQGKRDKVRVFRTKLTTYGTGAVYFLYGRDFTVSTRADPDIRTLAVVNFIGLAAGRVPYVCGVVPLGAPLPSADYSRCSLWLPSRPSPRCRFIAVVFLCCALTTCRRMTSLLISRFILQLRKDYTDAVLQPGGSFLGTTNVSSVGFVPLSDLDSQGRATSGV